MKNLALKRVLGKNGYIDSYFRENKFCNGILVRCKGILTSGLTLKNDLVFSNENSEMEIGILNNQGIDIAANETEGLYCIAPFGEFPHSKGLQVVDAEAANNLIKNFKSVASRIKNAFGNAVPVYQGHPDDDSFSEKYPDKAPYGKVTDIVMKNDKIYVALNKNTGFETLEKGQQLSPRWRMEQIAPNVFRPKSLVSIGLTTNPNIKGTDFANETLTSNNKDNNMLKNILLALGYSDEQAQAVIDKAADAVSEADIITKVKTLVSGQKTPEDDKKMQDMQTKLDDANTKAASNEAAYRAERKVRAEIVAANCVTEGRISKAEETGVVEILCNSTDFDSSSKLYQTLPQVHKTQSKTDGLGKRDSEEIVANESNAEGIRTRADEICANEKIPYQQAWDRAELEFKSKQKKG